MRPNKLRVAHGRRPVPGNPGPVSLRAFDHLQALMRTDSELASYLFACVVERGRRPAAASAAPAAAAASNPGYMPVPRSLWDEPGHAERYDGELPRTTGAFRYGDAAAAAAKPGVDYAPLPRSIFDEVKP